MKKIEFDIKCYQLLSDEINEFGPLLVKTHILKTS